MILQAHGTCHLTNGQSARVQQVSDRANLVQSTIIMHLKARFEALPAISDASIGT